MEEPKFNVLSPDGFTISFDDQYNTKEEAEAALNLWITRYEHQGYYSSVNYGRIPLNELKSYCKFISQPKYDEL